MLPRLFKKRTPTPRRIGIDALLSQVSILDGVVSVKLNEDGTIAIYVTDELHRAVPPLVELVNQLAPGTQGMVHRLRAASDVPIPLVEVVN